MADEIIYCVYKIYKMVFGRVTFKIDSTLEAIVNVPQPVKLKIS